MTFPEALGEDKHEYNRLNDIYYKINHVRVYIAAYKYTLKIHKYVDTPSNEWIRLFPPHPLLTGV
jgi:hypothetical protein